MRANLDARDADYDLAVAQYNKTLVKALLPGINMDNNTYDAIVVSRAITSPLLTLFLSNKLGLK